MGLDRVVARTDPGHPVEPAVTRPRRHFQNVQPAGVETSFGVQHAAAQALSSHRRRQGLVHLAQVAVAERRRRPVQVVVKGGLAAGHRLGRDPVYDRGQDDFTVPRHRLDQVLSAVQERFDDDARRAQIDAVGL